MRERRRVVNVRAAAVGRSGRRLVVVTRRQARGVARRGRDERREAESRARIHRTVGQARSRALGPSALHVSPRDRNVLGRDVKVSHLVVSVRVHAGLVFRERRRDVRGKRRDDLRWGRIGRSRWICARDRNVGAVATALGLRPAFLGNLAGLTRPRGSRVRVFGRSRHSRGSR